MKTVQEIMRSLDRKELIDAYAEQERIPFLGFEGKGAGQMTYAKLKKLYRRSLGEFLDRLLQTPIKKPEDGHQSIIFGFPNVKNDEPQHECIHLDELIKYREDTEAYAYSLTDWGEVMGYWVADTRYTREHMEEIMAQVMWEVSWWGFTADAVKKEREEMIKSLEELDASEGLSQQDQEDNEDMEEESLPYRILKRMKPPEDFANLPTEERLEREYQKAWGDYEDYLRGQELIQVLKSLPTSVVKGITGGT